MSGLVKVIFSSPHFNLHFKGKKKTTTETEEQRSSKWRTRSSGELLDHNAMFLERREAVWPPACSQEKLQEASNLPREQDLAINHHHKHSLERTCQGLTKAKPLHVISPCFTGPHRLLFLGKPRDKAGQAQDVHITVLITLCYQKDRTFRIATATEKKSIFPYLKTTIAPGHGGQARRKICN